MWLFFSVLALCATAWLVTRDLIGSGLWAYHEPQREAVPTSDETRIPEDLIGSHVTKYHEEWAAADASTYLLELRQKAGSWDAVRKILAQE